MADAMTTWKQLAAQLRIDSIRCTTAAGSGHPTSGMSAADLMAVLLEKYLKYDFATPKLPNNDRLIFSKGHACPVLYAMYKAAGVIDDEELLSLRKLGSRLEGHPNPHVLPYVDVATGSLGQGLPIGVGMALSGKYLDKLPFHVWVVLGDSEMAEGSIWEAFDKAQHYKLDNLIGILDMNRLGQRGETDLGWDSAAYAARVKAFGWNAIELDGHDLGAIDKAYEQATQRNGKPTCLIAKTKKGAGFDEIADKNGWHGKALDDELAAKAIAGLGGESSLTVAVHKPEHKLPQTTTPPKKVDLPTFDLGEKVATRQAYGKALTAMGSHDPDLVALDAEVSNSTMADGFKEAYPDRFFEMFIAEQQMLSAAVGFAVLGKTAFASTFSAFFTRAYDQIRMAAVSNATVRLCGSHAGVSIGEDGPSQMALEDLAMMRAVHESTVLYPCDANQTTQLVYHMASLSGISFLRSTREKTATIYKADEEFPVGGSKTIHSSDGDKATVVAAGITVHQALKAYETLQQEGIAIRVIDAYSVKPIDRDTLHQAAAETNGKLIVVEDHWPEGGLGDAVLEAFSGSKIENLHVVKLAVRGMPGSGTPAQLLNGAGIDAEHIVKAVKALK